MNRRTWLAMMVLPAALAACGGEGADPGAASGEQAARQERMRYEGEILAWRDQRVARLTRPNGWLSLVGMHWLAPGSTYVGSADDNGTRLSVGPAQIGMVTLGKDGSTVLRLHPDARAHVTIDGLPPPEGDIPLVADADAPEGGGPTVVGFNKGDASFIVIKRADRVGLRVRDALARTRTGFPGLDYFDINPDMRIVATFEPHPPGQTVDILNVLGMVEPMPNPGTLSFEKDGKTFRMEAVDEGDGQLFFTFADRTSGHQTYAASRMVYADPAGPDGKTVLDFNKAYNPPCAFTDYSTCPLPLPANRLDLAVEAGEKKPRPFPE
jgi:uncharacterized protein (DUF1684 family)